MAREIENIKVSQTQIQSAVEDIQNAITSYSSILSGLNSRLETISNKQNELSKDSGNGGIDLQSLKKGIDQLLNNLNNAQSADQSRRLETISKILNDVNIKIDVRKKAVIEADFFSLVPIFIFSLLTRKRFFCVI